MASTRTRLRGTRGRAPLRAPHRRPAGRRPHDRSWWRDGVLYQIYPRSFADADGDGDRRPARDPRAARPPRVARRRRHLAEPDVPSPNDDWGYDVADYCDVHPDLGTLEDLDELIAEAARRGIRVLLDLVPNHTSDRHAWFQDALGAATRPTATSTSGPTRSPTARRPTTGCRPSAARRGRSTSRRGQYYLHNFLPHPARPQLVERGGPRRVRRDPALLVRPRRRRLPHRRLPRRSSRTASCATTRRRRRRTTRTSAARPASRSYSMNRPEVHDVLRRWRAIADGEDPPRILVGETYVLDLEQLIPYYGAGEDELHLAFNFLVRARAARGRGAARRSSSASRRGCPRARGRSGRAPTTTPAGSPRAGRDGDPRARPRGAAAAHDPARHAVPLLRRRDRPARRRARPRGRARPGRRAARRPGGATATRCRTPMPWRRRPAPRLHRPAAARRRGCRSGRGPATSPTSAADPRLDAAPHARPDRAAARRAGPPARALRSPPRRPACA